MLEFERDFQKALHDDTRELHIIIRELRAYFEWVRERYKMKPDQQFDCVHMRRLELMTQTFGKNVAA